MTEMVLFISESSNTISTRLNFFFILIQLNFVLYVRKARKTAPRYRVVFCYFFFVIMCSLDICVITTIIIYRNIKNRRRWFLAFRPNTTGKYTRPFQMPVFFFGKNISIHHVLEICIYAERSEYIGKKQQAVIALSIMTICLVSIPFTYVWYLWYTAEETTWPLYIKCAECTEYYFPFSQFLNSAKKGERHSDSDRLVAPYYVYRAAYYTPHYTHDVTDFILFGKHFHFYIQPSILQHRDVYSQHTKPFIFISQNRIYCGRKHPWLTCSQKYRQNGCADTMHSRNMNYVFFGSM